MNEVFVTNTIVADQLDPRAEARGELLPAGPVDLADAVLEGHDRIAVQPGRPQVDQLARVERPLLRLEAVAARVSSSPVPSTRIDVTAGSSPSATSSPGR